MTPALALVLAALLPLAACAPDFGHGMGDLAAPAPTVPTTTVPNPFFCPGRAER